MCLSEFFSAIQSFLPEFLGSIVGVALGIPVALWIDRKNRVRGQREETIAILQALRDETNHNLDLIKQIQQELSDPRRVIFYTLDLSAWRVASIETLGSVINYEVLRRISRIYYEFEHLCRKIDVQFQMAYSTVIAIDGFPKMREQIITAIVDHASVLEKDCLSLISEIDKELGNLRDP